MANEAVQATGSYATAQASASSIADTNISTGAVTAIGSAIASESTYPLLDFQCNITSGTATAGQTVDLYRRPSDGTNQAPIPATADYLHQYVGSFTLDNATGYYYLYGVTNPDANDTYYMVNNSGATLTFALNVRGRTYGT